MTFSGTIAAADFATEFDAFRSRINASRAAAGKSWPMFHRMLALGSASSIAVRSITFTVDDDVQLRMIGVKAITTASVTITARLTALDAIEADASAELLQGESVSVGVTVNGTGTARDATPFATTDGRSRHIRLLRGARYRLALENSAVANCTVAEAILLLRAYRRRT